MKRVEGAADLNEGVRHFIEKFGWSQHIVAVTSKTANLGEIRTWCNEQIGPQLDPHVFGVAIEEFFWMAVVNERFPLPSVTFVFRFDKDAVHFKLRWIG